MWNNYDCYHPSVKAKYDEKHEWWMLVRGPETFYDENNKLRIWDTKEKALEWVKLNHPEYRIEE